MEEVQIVWEEAKEKEEEVQVLWKEEEDQEEDVQIIWEVAKEKGEEVQVQGKKIEYKEEKVQVLLEVVEEEEVKCLGEVVIESKEDNKFVKKRKEVAGKGEVESKFGSNTDLATSVVFDYLMKVEPKLGREVQKKFKLKESEVSVTLEVVKVFKQRKMCEVVKK